MSAPIYDALVRELGDPLAGPVEAIVTYTHLPLQRRWDRFAYSVDSFLAARSRLIARGLIA